MKMPNQCAAGIYDMNHSHLAKKKQQQKNDKQKLTKEIADELLFWCKDQGVILKKCRVWSLWVFISKEHTDVESGLE